MTTSTPYGFPPTCSSSQRSSTSSCSFEKASAPSTPSPPARLTAATTSRQWLKAKRGSSMPSRSQTRVRKKSAPLGCEAHRHPLDAVDEVRAQALDRPGQLDVRQAAQQLLEHDLDLQAGQVGAQAEVMPDAKGEVVVRRAADVETVGVREDLLVAGGRAIPDGQLVALADRLGPPLRGARRRAPGGPGRRDPRPP